MKKLLISLLLSVILVSCSSIYNKFDSKIQTLKEERVHLVDHHNGNFLVRGNMPFTIGSDGKKEYDHYDLVKYSLSSIKKEGIKTKDWNDYYVIDVMLTNRVNPVEEIAFEKTKKFYKQNSELGKVEMFSVLNPNDLIPDNLLSYSDIQVVEKFSKKKFSTKFNERMLKRVRETKKLLRDGKINGKNVIIYVHCMAGCDRTGEFVSAYNLVNNDMKYKEAIELNTKQCTRKPNKYSMRGSKSFCYFYKYNKLHLGQSCKI